MSKSQHIDRKFVVAALRITVAILIVVILIMLQFPTQEKKLALRTAPATPTAELTVYPDGTVVNATGLIVFNAIDTSIAIQWALDHASSIAMAAGTYDLTTALNLPNNCSLAGAGSSGSGATILSSSSLVYINMSNDCLLSSFQTRGDVIVGAHSSSSMTNLTLNDISSVGAESKIPACFLFRVSSYATMNNISMFSCRALDANTYGFLFIGSEKQESTYGSFNNVWLQSCVASGCGVDARPNDYVVGFDLGEMANVNGMVVIHCRAERNWESGFHWEAYPSFHDIVVQDCDSSDNGQKTRPLYGAGYWLSSSANRGSFELINCTGTGNPGGLYRRG